jgi:hypothetical protein
MKGWAARIIAIQYAVGLGNTKGVTGWLTGAFLGNNVASALDLMQTAWGGSSGVANGMGQAFGSNVAVAGGKRGGKPSAKCRSRRRTVFGVLGGSTAISLVRPFDPKAMRRNWHSRSYLRSQSFEKDA